MTLTAAGLASEGRPRFAHAVSAILGGFIAVAVVPAALMDFARSHAEYTEYFNEPWPNEPELVAFFKTKVGRAIGEPIRGSVHFRSYSFELVLTIDALWSQCRSHHRRVQPAGYPQALYALHAVLQNNVTGVLNGFASCSRPILGHVLQDAASCSGYGTTWPSPVARCGGGRPVFRILLSRAGR